jgi:hypothetical protein
MSVILATILYHPVCGQRTKFQRFTKLNTEVRQLHNDHKTHLITTIVNSSEYFTTWKRRNFLYNGKFLDWNYDDVLVTYKLIGEAYVRDHEPDKARRFVKRMLILEPEYLYRHETDLKYLLRRFVVLKFTVGVNGIGTLVFPQTKGESVYQPDEGTSSDEVSYGKGLKSSFFAGVELLHNPALKSPIHSIDFYLEYMFHSDRIYHQQTRYTNIGEYTSTVSNRITELQDWQSLLVYPRLSLNTSNEQWTVFFLAGVGLNQLMSAEFFEIHQRTDTGPSIELSPVKLYKKEKMRIGRNVSMLGGVGLNYTVSRNITFYLSGRYMKMIDNLTTDYSLNAKPLQGPPHYYTDAKLYIHHVSLVGGVAANIGACPRWLGF